MRRRLIWSAIAFAVVATLATLWFIDNFEQVPVKRWEGMKKEAIRNPYLASERLFAKLGRPVRRIHSPTSLDALPTGGVLLLDGNRRRNVDTARTQRVLDWVAHGAYLIVEAEYAGDDPLLEQLNVSRYTPSPLQCPKKPETGEKTGANTEESASRSDNAETSEAIDTSEEPEESEPPIPLQPAQTRPPLEFTLPGTDAPIRYRMAFAGRGLTAGGTTPVWRAGPSEDRSAIMHFTHGKGQVTVVDTLDLLGNRKLVEHDHAELIWALLQRYQPQGEILLASRMEIPTLWEWLAESAWMTLLSAATLILLWLWRIVPRFGGTLPAAVSERRDLAQHLHAIGRSLWREGGLVHLLTVVRRGIHKRLTLRHPHLARRPSQEQRKALARLIGKRSRDIQAAMASTATPSPEEFTRAMQTLQRLDQKL